MVPTLTIQSSYPFYIWKWLARSYEGKEYPNKRNIVVGNDV
jgi:hypothetical protein